MVPGVSSSASATGLSKSLEALDALLRASQSRVMDLADRLLKVQVQKVVQDGSLGTRIDTSA